MRRGMRVMFVIGVLVAGMLSGCLSNWDEARDARGTQEDSDVHMYDHTGEYVGEVNTCPLFSDFSSPQERSVAKGIIPTPDDGVHTDGEIKIIDPVDFQGGIAVFSYLRQVMRSEDEISYASRADNGSDERQHGCHPQGRRVWNGRHRKDL